MSTTSPVRNVNEVLSAQFTTTFEPGDYLIVCNEFCGLAHHIMQGRLVAEVMP